MIAFAERLPLIELPSGLAVAFDRAWLLRSLHRAAARAGFAEWWLADHVAQSVTAFLRQQEELTVLTLDRLTGAVRSVLEAIGYTEVGQQFAALRPWVRISLLELAREAGTGYELAFFDLLARRIHEAVCLQGCDFELGDLDGSVRVLKARKSWSRDCDSLRAEIIHFSRTHTTQVAGLEEVSFSLS